MPAVMLVPTLGRDERGAESTHRDLQPLPMSRWYVAKQGWSLAGGRCGLVGARNSWVSRVGRPW
jgi:hypothetical protein